MRRVLLTTAIVAIASPAYANAWLVAERVAVGVNPDGSLCDPARQLCLMYDPDGPEGPIPLGRDLLLPGRAFEAWGASWTAGGQRYVVSASAPDAGGPVTLTWAPPRTTPDFVSIVGEGDVGPGLRVRVNIDVARDGDVVYLTHTWLPSVDVTGLEASRSIDLDPDFFRDRSYATRNEAAGEVAVSTSRYEVGAAIAVGVSGGVGAVCTSWCVNPDGLRSGVAGPVEADRVIGARVGPVDAAAGTQVVHRFVYALGADGPTVRERATAAIGVVDLDGDGQTPDAGDCDDRDSTVYDGAPELADGVDNDCDDAVDEGTSRVDGDGDGFSPLSGDCDDDDDRVFPGAPAVDGVRDANCDGIADDGAFDDGAPPAGWGETVDEVGGGCETVGVPPWAMWTLGLIPLAAARRRRLG